MTMNTSMLLSVVAAALVAIPVTLSLEVDNATAFGMTCAEPNSIPNAVFMLETDRSTVEYVCRPGYVLVGSAQAVCREDGNWSEQPPLCLGRGCTKLSVKHATMLSSYSGQLVRFRCRKHFRLVGPETLACVGDQWNGTQPACVHERRAGRSDAVTNGVQSSNEEDDVKLASKRSHRQWLSESDYSCVGVDGIVPAPTVQYARHFTQWAMHAGRPRLYASYQCKWGYTLAPGAGRTMYCNRQRWIGPTPKCQPVSGEEDDTELQGDMTGSGRPLTHDQLLRRADYSCISVNPHRTVDPPDVENASPPRLKFAIVGAKPHLYAEYSCLPGYLLQDESSKYTYCRRQAWIGQLPVCVEADDAAVDGCLTDNGGCEQLCQSDQRIAVCDCKPGFTLDDNQRSCNDIDECEVNNAGCAQLCDNTDGSFECTCYRGFQLNMDLVTCSRTLPQPLAGHYNDAE